MNERSLGAQDLGVPINGETAAYEEVTNWPSSVYAELNRNQEDEKTNFNTYQKLIKHNSLCYVIPVDVESSYAVPNSSPSVYAELNRNQESETRNDSTYQKLLKPYLDYIIPANVGEDHPYEKIEKNRSLPGYAELDQTKREDLDASYQKLMKK